MLHKGLVPPLTLNWLVAGLFSDIKQLQAATSKVYKKEKKSNREETYSSPPSTCLFPFDPFLNLLLSMAFSSIATVWETSQKVNTRKHKRKCTFHVCQSIALGETIPKSHAAASGALVRTF